MSEEFDFSDVVEESPTQDQQFDFSDIVDDSVKKKELSPLDNFSNYFQNTLTTTAQLPEIGRLALEQAKENVEKGALWLANNTIGRIGGVEPISYEEFEKRNEYKSTQKQQRVGEALSSLQESNQKIEPTVGIIQAAKAGDPLMTVSSIGGTVVDTFRSVLTGMASGGIVPVAEMVGRSYYEALAEKSRVTGIPEAELVKIDQDDELVPATLGVAGGLLEKFGLKGITKQMMSQPVRQGLREALSLSGTATKEGFTEWLQYGIEEGNKAIAGTDGDFTKDSEIFISAVSNALMSEQGAEAFTAGMVGGGGIGAVSSAVKRGIESAEKGDLDAVDQLLLSERDPETEVSDLNKIADEIEFDEAGAVDAIENQLSEEDIAIESAIKNAENQQFVQNVQKEGEINKSVQKAEEVSAVEELKEIKESENIDFEEKGVLGDVMSNKVVSGLRNMPLKILEIAKTNDKAAAFIDKNVKQPLDEAQSLTDIEVRNQKDRIQSFINDYQIPEQGLKRIGIDGMINTTEADPRLQPEEYAAEIQDNKNKVLRAADNKIRYYEPKSGLDKLNIVKKAKYKKALEEKELVEDYIRSGQTLTEQEREVSNYMKNYFNEKLPQYRTVSIQEWGNDVKQLNNYFPSRAVGGYQTQEHNSNIQKEIEDKLLNKSSSREEGKPKISRGYHTKEKAEDIGSAFYELNGANLFLDYVGNSTFDIEGTKNVREVVSLLSNKDFQKEIGKENANALLASVKGFVNRQRGIRRPEIFKTLDKYRSNIITTTLGTPEQFIKQFGPALGQALSLTNGNPKTYLKALGNLTKIDNDWLQEHAPSLYERSLSLDRITFDEKSDELSGYSKIRKLRSALGRKSDEFTSGPISWGDNLAARLAFAASFTQRGGDVNNPDPKIVRQAQLDQEALQNVNTSAFSGEIFNSENSAAMLLTRTALTFTNFALQQTFSFLTGVQNINTARGRQLAAGSLTSAVVFAGIASAIRGVIDEVYDEALGEDQEDDPVDDINSVESDFALKTGVRGIKDVLVGGIPFVSGTVEAGVEQINKIIRGEDYDQREDAIFYVPFDNNQATDFLGAPLERSLEMATNVLGNTQDVIQDGDEQNIDKLLVSVGRFMNMMLRGLPIRGEVDRYLREVDQRIKKEIREDKKASKRKSNPVNRVILN